jgi:hypothetical protein
MIISTGHDLGVMLSCFSVCNDFWYLEPFGVQVCLILFNFDTKKIFFFVGFEFLLACVLIYVCLCE